MLKITLNALFFKGLSLLSRRIWLCLLLVFGFSYNRVTSAAVPIIGNTENATWEIFTARQTINSVFPATKEGYLWIATEGGLEKRDLAGDKLLRLYTTLDGLSTNEITVLTGDCQAGVWVGTPDGVYHVLVSGELVTFSTLAVDTNTTMAPDCHGGLWFSHGEGFKHIKADATAEDFDRNNSDLPSDVVNGLAYDGAGGVFIGTNAGVAWWLEDGSWQIFNKFNSPLPDNDIQTLINDNAGGFWVELIDHVVHYANGDWQPFEKAREGLPNGQIMFANQEWITWMQDTENTTYQMVDGQWQVFLVDQSGLTDNAVWALSSENTDNLLVWTGEGGLSRLAEKHWETLQKASQQFFVKVTALAMDGGGLWVSGFKEESGDALLALFKEGSFFKEPIKVFNINKLITNKDDDSYFTTLLPDGKGGIWAGTTDGLSHILADGSSKEFNPIKSVHSMIFDGNGGVWVGTWPILLHILADGSIEGFKPTANSGFPGVDSIISDDNGGIWIGADGLLAHRDADGRWEEVFIGSNEDRVYPLHSDGTSGIWPGTVGSKDLNHLYSTFEGHWAGDPETVFSIQLDGKDGIWAATEDSNIYYLQSQMDTWDIHEYDELFTGEPSQTLVDSSGGFWVGTEGNNSSGLVHLSANGTSEIFNISNSALPHNQIHALQSDGEDGLWIGTDSGLAHFYADEKWESELLGFQANFIRPDGVGGYWIGTEKDFGHLTDDSKFKKLLSVNSQAFLWKGTDEFYVGATDGLHHFTSKGHEHVNIPDRPENNVTVLLRQNGLWMGTTTGLLYQDTDGSWNTFTTANSKLPIDHIHSLFPDGSGGIWVWTVAGHLAHLKSTWTWEVTNDLVYGEIQSVMLDEAGGFWVGTDKGLEHVKADMTVESFSSGLPNKNVRSLAPDGRGGLYAGTLGGLAHLSFGHQAALIEQVQQSADTSATETESEESLTILKGQRAAILIAGGGSHYGNTLWDTTESISNYLYKVFNNRGFLNEEIYYISPKSWADFNGDGLNDHIVDAPKSERPLAVDDIRDAFAWAKNRGQLDQPLYVFFLDHGSTTRFQLGKLTYMDVLEFKDILDDYQNTTGNEMVLVIEACYSGVLLEQLIAPNRAIISSTGNGLAYFDRMSRQGFSRFLAIGLIKGMNFYEAFEYANRKQTKLLGNISQLLVGSRATSENISQVPQLNDGNDGHWLRQLYLNGSFVTGDLTLAIEGMTTSTTLTAGQSMTLQAKAVLAEGNITRVWAVLRPPRLNLVMDSNGTPILAFPRLPLSPTAEPDIWETTWQDAVYNGDYEITFYAEDNEGNIASSDNPLIISVIGGVDSPPHATVQLVLEKDRYRPGEPINAQLIEDLGWGYDLYAAVVLPDGNFFALTNANEFAPLNQPKNWLKPRTQNRPATLLDLTLPANLPTGEYCLYGILSPEKENVFKTLDKGLWVMEKRCFEVLP